MGTHKLYLAYGDEQCKAIQDIREIELRDSGSNANTGIYFEVRTTALRLAFTKKDFYYVYTGRFTKGPPLKNYTLQPWSIQLELSHLYTRGSTITFT